MKRIPRLALATPRLRRAPARLRRASTRSRPVTSVPGRRAHARERVLGWPSLIHAALSPPTRAIAARGHRDTNDRGSRQTRRGAWARETSSPRHPARGSRDLRADGPGRSSRRAGPPGSSTPTPALAASAAARMLRLTCQLGPRRPRPRLPQLFAQVTCAAPAAAHERDQYGQIADEERDRHGPRRHASERRDHRRIGHVEPVATRRRRELRGERCDGRSHTCSFYLDRAPEYRCSRTRAGTAIRGRAADMSGVALRSGPRRAAMALMSSPSRPRTPRRIAASATRTVRIDRTPPPLR